MSEGIPIFYLPTESVVILWASFLCNKPTDILDDGRISGSDSYDGETEYTEDNNALPYFLIMAIIILIQGVKFFLRGHIVSFFDEPCLKIIFLFRSMIKAISCLFHPVSHDSDAGFCEIDGCMVFNVIDVCHGLIPLLSLYCRLEQIMGLISAVVSAIILTDNNVCFN